MSVRYLYNTPGEYVAFISGSAVFSPMMDWLGVIKNGNEMYGTDGEFFGYVLDDDRVAYRTDAMLPRIPRPPRPTRPLRPLRPLRRLRMARLPRPYQDAFQSGPPKAKLPAVPVEASSFAHLIGCRLVADDGQPLGIIDTNKFSTDSLTNQFGPYGNPFNPNSIFNRFGNYGNPHSAKSPFNPYTTTPPKIMRGETQVGLLTANPYLAGRVDTNAFIAWLQS